jgi:hypothetical protein
MRFENDRKTETQNIQGEKTIAYAIKIYVLNAWLLVPVEFQSPKI